MDPADDVDQDAEQDVWIDDDEDGEDFAFAAWREEGRWYVEELPLRGDEGLVDLQKALVAHPGDNGCLGFVGVQDEFLVLIRVGAGVPKLFVSDAGAATSWDLGEEALQALDVEIYDDDEFDYEPAGDPYLFADLGLPPSELELLVEDQDNELEDIVAAIAQRLGFGEKFQEALAGS